MNRFIKQLLPVIILLLPASAAYGQPGTAATTRFINFLAGGDAAAAYRLTDTLFQQKVKPEQLTMAWQQLEGKYGKWTGVKVLQAENAEKGAVVLTRNDFEQGIIDFRVPVSPDGKISGFTIVQITEKADTSVRLPEHVKEEEITVHTPDGDLKGSLTLPDKGGSYPVVLLIAGSGPTDRNGNSIMGIKAGGYRMLAYALGMQGIGCLRYDKRLVGASTGFRQTPAELTLEDFIKDAAACLQLLKKDKRCSSVYVAGHSEGALTGMLVVLKEKAAGFISLMGAGQPVDQILKSQIKTMNPDHYEESLNIIAAIKSGSPLPEVPEPLKIIFNSSTQNFLHSCFQYDPAEVIGKLSLPVLIISGSHDLQIMESDGRLLANARPGAVRVRIDNMNHVLKPSPADVTGNLKTYADPRIPVDTTLVRTIAGFVTHGK